MVMDGRIHDLATYDNWEFVHRFTISNDGAAILYWMRLSAAGPYQAFLSETRATTHLRTQGIRSRFFQYQGNCFAEVLQTLLPGFALPICSRHFGTIRDVPGAVLLHDHGELMVHSAF
jgi:hypothetical protein